MVLAGSSKSFYFAFLFCCHVSVTTSFCLPSTIQSVPTRLQPLLLETRAISQNASEEPSLPRDELPKQHDEKRFFNPLLEFGYRPAVEDEQRSRKPILIYLPGFDGTFLSPFLQFPELSTVFDIQCLTIPPADRSSYDDMVDFVLKFVVSVSRNDDVPKSSNPFFNWKGAFRQQRPVYLAGESFGGILASDVALQLRQQDVNLRGMCLVNPATSFDRSRLASEGPPVANLGPFLFPFGALRLLSLFMDEHSLAQLLLILQAKRLPSVIDTAAREAYMGRVAFSLPWIIPILTPNVLQWRLQEWLTVGCARMSTKLDEYREYDLRTLIVVGENDQTLPSIAEAARLSDLIQRVNVHVVPGAGHASTCGSRVDMAALFRSTFTELRSKGSRTEMQPEAASGKGPFYGMIPRYDNATIGLNPFRYWNSEFYLKPSNATIAS